MPERTSSSVSPSAPLSGYSLPRYSPNARRMISRTLAASSRPAARICKLISLELVPVFCRSDADAVAERKPERLGRGEAAALGDPVDRLAGRLDQLLRAGDPLVQQPRLRARPGCLAKA